MTPYLLALDSLCNTLNKGRYSNMELKTALADSGLNTKDRALYKQLYFGVLERLCLLDFIIGKFSKKKPEQMQPQLVNILRIGVYGIMFMNLSDSAVVNNCVDLGKKRVNFAAAFINGLLRNVARNKETVLQDNIPPNVRYSVSLEAYTLLRSQWGKDINGFLEGAYENIPVTLRVNTLKTTPEKLIEILKTENIEAQGSEILTVKAHTSIENTNSYKSGLYHIQGKASQNAVALLDLHPGMTVIDFCSAPGSKSFLAAQLMENKGEIYAFDLYPHRVDLIKKGASRLGIGIIKAMAADTSVSLPIDIMADRIICDMPCSGLGMLSKRPEIRYKDLSEIDELIRLQGAILENACKYLKKGGRLLYSTCTINKNENEGVLESFLKNHPEFSYAQPPKTYMTCGEEGFFTALLEKKNDR